MVHRIIWLLLFLSMAAGHNCYAQSTESSSSALYIIFDGSNSMWGELPDKSRKIAVAKQVFNDLDPVLFTDREVALRLYGHRRAGDCSDSELAVPFIQADKAVAQMAERVNAVTPRGKTPITRSLQAALDDFGQRHGDILLISDGIETCDADPCALVGSWRDQGINIRVHVVGLGLDSLARDAMQCIADASGTVYRDAATSTDLSAAIEQTAAGDPPVPGEANPQPQPAGAEFRLVGQDAEGRFVPVAGSMQQGNADAVEVTSNARFVFDGGSYSLTAGVPTLNDVIYQPVTQDVEVLEAGETRVTVTVPRPPVVNTRFVSDGEDIRGVLVTAFQNGEQVFNLRPNEEHFVLPGTYEFRARLDQDNDLTITETIQPGQDKVLLFEAVKTVRAVFVVRPEGEQRGLRQHQELLQNGEVKYKVHVSNGADVRPGVYTLKSDDPLTPYSIDNVTVTGEQRQRIELTVPFGKVQAQYVFKGEPPTSDMRCWFEKLDQANEVIAGSRALQCDGTGISVAAGRYRVRVWTRLGDFEPAEFNVTNGETTEIAVVER